MELDPMVERKARQIGVESDQFAYEDRGQVDPSHVVETLLNEVSW